MSRLACILFNLKIIIYEKQKNYEKGSVDSDTEDYYFYNPMLHIYDVHKYGRKIIFNQLSIIIDDSLKRKLESTLL